MSLKGIVAAGLAGFFLMVSAGHAQAYGAANAFAYVNFNEIYYVIPEPPEGEEPTDEPYAPVEVFFDWSLAGSNLTPYTTPVPVPEADLQLEEYGDWYDSRDFSDEGNEVYSEVYVSQNEMSAYAGVISDEDPSLPLSADAWLQKSGAIRILTPGYYEITGSYYLSRYIEVDESTPASSNSWARLMLGDETFTYAAGDDLSGEGFEGEETWFSGMLAAGDHPFTIEVYAGASLDEFDKTAAVPEPASMLLFGLGGAGLAFARRRQLFSKV